MMFIKTSLEESLIAALPAHSKNPWALPGATWFVLIMALGDIAMSAYVLVQLFHLGPKDGVECLLKRRAA